MIARFSRSHTVAALAALLCLCLALPSVFAHPEGETVSIQCGFSRDAKAMDLILGLIRNARESIVVPAYSFTAHCRELRNAHKHGVSVPVVTDGKANRTIYTAVTFLANQGLPVRLNDQYVIMHHKFMVVDGRHVQTGNFNCTQAANRRNAENVLVLRALPNLAEQYAQEWMKLWNEAKDLPPNY